MENDDEGLWKELVQIDHSYLARSHPIWSKIEGQAETITTSARWV